MPDGDRPSRFSARHLTATALRDLLVMGTHVRIR